ncbi:Hypothetical protein HVPorG_04774 (plasmid) [Roseomonas mucosa]|uniref:Uncharacterized protein n=1 Tax=Roseomonas mucosa TaxID=207340 RepID=A0A4Y1MRL4_9PROT|nr:hypothetical protein [Roseomonas mucosa]AWV20622.1 Hypothetical protein RADP37_04774 [Roseomonas mucosa]MDT8262034.1 hypothetical protein [Roseomonas sp. DSM 102946]MDT8356678.1 hypothetical protein [Roseomonas mucosa]QDJ12328.1 Hypothetical protein HVPorG_04774 [Roseomonas mucosa]
MSRPRVVIFPGLTPASEWEMMAGATMDIALAARACGDEAEYRIQAERAEAYHQEAEKMVALMVTVEDANLAEPAAELLPWL